MIYSRKELQATILGLKPLFNPLFRFSGLSFTPHSNEAIPGILPGNALKAFVTSLIWSDVAPALYLKATILILRSCQHEESPEKGFSCFQNQAVAGVGPGRSG